MERVPSPRLWLLSPILIVAGVLALFIDVYATAWFRDLKCPRLLSGFIAQGEAFAEGHAVVVLLLTVWVLDVKNRWRIPRLAAASLGAGILANVLKLFIVRTRPYYFFEKMHDVTIWDSFRGWSGLNIGDSAFQGFPSAHMATAVGLAIALTWLYPRGWWLFTLLAVLAGAQRVGSSHHFVSDVCWGGALGGVVSLVCLRVSWCQRFFAMIENRRPLAMTLPEIREKKIEALSEIR